MQSRLDIRQGSTRKYRGFLRKHRGFGEYIENIPQTNLMERSKSSSLKKPSVKFEKWF